MIVDSLTLNQLVLHLNLNRSIAKKCVDEMIRNGFVEVKHARFDVYSSTPKGADWMGRYVKITQEYTSKVDIIRA